MTENIFVVGTVNIDETTYMFSPKVLDRASVIDFRVKAEEIETHLTKHGDGVRVIALWVDDATTSVIEPMTA